MALTIEQLQTFVDSNPDLRQLINAVVDYIQANPSGDGGGASTLQEVIDEGAVLDKDNIINAGQHAFSISDTTGTTISSRTLDESEEGYIDIHPTEMQISVYNDTDEVILEITPTSATINKNGAGAKEIASIAIADDYADDAAAAVGNIAVGQQYHTSGTVKVRLA